MEPEPRFKTLARQDPSQVAAREEYSSPERSQLRLHMNSLSYTGPTTVDGGNLQFRNTADLKGFSSNALNIEGGGSLVIQSSVGGANRTVLNNKTWTFDNGGGTLSFNGGNNLFQAGG